MRKNKVDNNKKQTPLRDGCNASVLSIVATYGGCTPDHVRRRLGTCLGSRSAAYVRIGRLVQRRFLSATRLPALAGVGSGKHFLTITGAGRKRLTGAGCVATAATSRKAVAPAVAAHLLAVLDVRIAVELSCDESGVLLDEWQPEHVCRRSPLRTVDPATGADVAVVPDGRFTLTRRDGATQTFSLEVDRGTTTATRMRTKLRVYLAARTADARAVLFIVPDRSRRDKVAAWALAEAALLGADPSIFWLAESEDVQRASCIADPIWRVVGGPEHAALVQVPGGAARAGP